jgi:phosphatidate cytidylyltransferase
MKRVLTAVVAIPLAVLITLYAPDWLFAFVVGVLCGVAVEEFLSLGDKRRFGRPGRWFLVPAAGVAVSFIGGPGWVLNTFVFTLLVLMTSVIFNGPLETGLARVAMGLGGVAYCGLTLGFLNLMAATMPRELILLLLAIIWIGDSAAFYCGRAFGRHLLIPKVSPKKTVEGAVAGLIGSVIVGTLAGVWLFGESVLSLVAISSVTAIVGQLGDLAESVLKRSAGVKDSSSILPGHGGILDRLDSLFFAAPVFYWFFNA